MALSVPHWYCHFMLKMVLISYTGIQYYFEVKLAYFGIPYNQGIHVKSNILSFSSLLPFNLSYICEIHICFVTKKMSIRNMRLKFGKHYEKFRKHWQAVSQIITRAPLFLHHSSPIWVVIVNGSLSNSRNNEESFKAGFDKIQKPSFTCLTKPEHPFFCIAVRGDF